MPLTRFIPCTSLLLLSRSLRACTQECGRSFASSRLPPTFQDRWQASRTRRLLISSTSGSWPEGNRCPDPRGSEDHRPLYPAVRTYSSTGGVELVAPIADEFDLKVTVGAWIDKHQDRNEREMRAATELARKNRNVNALVIGNETIYRGDQTIEQLIKLIIVPNARPRFQ